MIHIEIRKNSASKVTYFLYVSDPDKPVVKRLVESLEYEGFDIQVKSIKEMEDRKQDPKLEPFRASLTLNEDLCSF